MPGRFSELLRLLLPGAFAEVHHWRERALNAEARLSDLVGQIAETMAREREEWRNEREQLLGRPRGELSLPLPPEDDGRNGRMCPPVPRASPIARAYAKAQEETAVPDDFVNEIVDDYLKMKAGT